MTSLIRFAAFLLALIALGCAKNAPPAPGQLMVTLVTDLAPPKDFDEVRVLVTYKGEAKHDTTYALRGSAAIKLPATFAVIAGSEPATPVDVHVEARLRGKVVVVRDARTTVPGDRIANLTIPIEFLCVGQVSGGGASLCAAEQTCMGGSCGPSTIDASALPTFDPTGVFGGAKEPGASGRCFDVLDCFGEAEPVTADAACSLAIPADRGSGLNVALLNAERTQGICASNACLVVLDNDGARGWVEANGRIQLPAAACTPARNGSRALVATRCATKKPSDPPCGSWSSSGSVATDGTLVEINLGDAGAPNSGDGGVGDSGVVPQDICSQNNGGCSAYATCAVGDGGAPVCTCRPGYTGDGLGCIDVNECLVDRGGCAVDATCTNTPGSRTCVCNAGYAGNGLSCADVDECATQNGGCSADATCTNRLGFRTCTCTSGFSGDGLTCADVNECASSNGGCAVDAQCTNLLGNRSCTCLAGYTGTGLVCTDENECATSNGGCAVFAQCTNLPGSRSCACQAGFVGDGVTCANVDECQANATLCGTASAGTCTDTPGAYACTCKPGYTLENGTCVDINECATQNGGCSANATCTNTTGSRSCACNSGWSGDGVSCACTGESDASLCARAGQNCGALTATDNCGAVRSLASCGSCGNNATCGTGATSGVCACNAGYVGNGTTCVVDQTCTAVSGVLTQNTTWTAAQSPYCVNGNVLVQQGVTLTIEAGVLAKFAVGKSMQVDGTLKVLGTEQAHVAFDCQRPAVNNDPEACWGQLKFTDTAEDAVFDSQGNYASGSMLRWVELTRGGNVSTAAAVVDVVAARLYADNVVVRRSVGTVFAMSRQTTSSVLKHFVASNNTGSVLRLAGACATVVAGEFSANRAASTVEADAPYAYDGSGVWPCSTRIEDTAFSDAVTNAELLVVSGHVSVVGSTFRGASDSNLASAGSVAVRVYRGGVEVEGSSFANPNGALFDLKSSDWSAIRNSILVADGGAAIVKNQSDSFEDFGGSFVETPRPNWLPAGASTYIEGSLIRHRSGGIFTPVGGTFVAGVMMMGNGSAGNMALGPSSQVKDSSLYSSAGPSLFSCSGCSVERSSFVVSPGPRTANSQGLGWPTLGRYDDISIGAGTTITRSNLSGRISVGLASSGGGGNRSATGNYWGTTSDSAIQSILWDWNDDSSLGFINYTPFLTAPSTDAPLLPPSGVTKVVDGSGVRVSWNANTEADLAGYRVFWGSSDGFFWAHSVEVPSGTLYVIPNVPITERFAVAAYDTTRSGVSYTDRVSGHEGWPTEAVGP